MNYDALECNLELRPFCIGETECSRCCECPNYGDTDADIDEDFGHFEPCDGDQNPCPLGRLFRQSTVSHEVLYED